MRTLPLGGTRFSFLYTVAAETVWIIDIHDQRGARSAEALRQFNHALRDRMRDLPET